MGIEGALRLRVRWDGRRVQALEIASTRAVAASRVLEGKAPREAAALVPMLFSLCGRGQGVAALRAWEAALGREPDAAAVRARAWAVAAEAVQENLWRLMLDWPDALGETPATGAFAVWHRKLSALIAAVTKAEGWSDPGAPVAVPERELAAAGAELAEFLGNRLVGTGVEEWCGTGFTAMKVWWQEVPSPAAQVLRRLFEGEGLAGRSPVPLMGAATPKNLARVLERTLREPGFAARPDWNGEPRETGALARLRAHSTIAGALAGYGNCTAVRVLARLIETATLALKLADDAQAPAVDGMTLGPGIGAAWVETSRGLLAHVVELENGSIARYRILAPTEWNFHPDGPLARGLTGAEADTEPALVRTVRLQALALDPCVAWETEIARA